jgi:subtilisin family serine protease
LLVVSSSFSFAAGKIRATESDSADLKQYASIATRFGNKLSPSLLSAVAANPEKVQIIVNLHEPITAQRVFNFANDADVKSYMAAADKHIQAVTDSVSASDLKVTQRYLVSNGFAGEITLAGLEQLASHPDVQAINAESWKKLLRVEGKNLMNVPAVHTLGAKGLGVTVAVIDDGIDYSHKELGNTAIGTFPNSVVIGGHDFVPPGSTEPSPFPRDSDNSHGTSVAGIIAGRGGDGRGGTGVAPEAKLVGLRIAGPDGIPTSREIQALNWIVSNRTAVSPAIKIVNMSIGGEPYVINGCENHPQIDTEERDAVNRVHNAGVAVVASSGNEAKIGMGVPACFNNVISVGAVYDANIGSADFGDCSDPSTSADLVTCYSNIDNKTTLYAPSHDAYSPSAGSGSPYDVGFGGTSAASPYAAGALAILMGKFPGRTIAQQVETLRSTGKPITYTQPGVSITIPRVNLLAAYQSLDGTGTGGGPCTPGTNKVCLQNNRFEVTMTGSFNGATHPGAGTKVSNQFGYFSIPGLTGDPTNIEVFVKIAGPVDGQYWVFYGGISGFTVNITIKDTTRGTTKNYNMPGGSYQGAGKFSDFPQ